MRSTLCLQKLLYHNFCIFLFKILFTCTTHSFNYNTILLWTQWTQTKPMKWTQSESPPPIFQMHLNGSIKKSWMKCHPDFWLYLRDIWQKVWFGITRHGSGNIWKVSMFRILSKISTRLATRSNRNNRQLSVGEGRNATSGV